jgi:hypothetical protein
MKFELSGTVETCLPLQEFLSGFKKRILVINTGGQYPQLIPVDFNKDKTDLLTGLVKNQPVKVSANLQGNEYNGKYFLNAQGWKIEKSEKKDGTDEWFDK